MTRPNKDSLSCRIIVDLSRPPPPGHSINGGTPTDTYMGVPCKLKLPSVDTMRHLIKINGRGSYLYAMSIPPQKLQDTLQLLLNWSVVL